MPAQVGKGRNLGEEEEDSGQAMHLITRNKGKRPIVPDKVDTLADDELSSGNSLPLNPFPKKNTKAKSCKRTLHRPTFSDAISGASHRARREAGRGQNQAD